MDRSQEEEVEEWLNKVYPEFMASYYAFKLKDANCFPTYLFNDSVKSAASTEMKESKSMIVAHLSSLFWIH